LREINGCRRAPPFPSGREGCSVHQITTRKGKNVRKLGVLIALSALLLAVTSSAAAHIIVVTPSGGGQGTAHWVGGGPVPGRGAALLESPIGMLPPSHAMGLVHACLMANGSGAVMFIPPPFDIPDTDCMHGEH
jgi:hypothetical protein